MEPTFLNGGSSEFTRAGRFHQNIKNYGSFFAFFLPNLQLQDTLVHFSSSQKVTSKHGMTELKRHTIRMDYSRQRSYYFFGGFISLTELPRLKKILKK